MEAGMGAPAPVPHQDDRLREQFVQEREDAGRRRDSLVAEMEAQNVYHSQEIDRCERVMRACSDALEAIEAIDPPKMATSVPAPRDHDSQRSMPMQGGIPR